MTAFFDSISMAILIPLALEQGFNPWILGMAIRTHMGPRAFKEGKFISSWFLPSGLSILAGCLTSVSLTGALLYDTLDHMHRQFRPIQIKSWVDDLFQLHAGPKEFIVPHAHAAAIALVRMLQAKKTQNFGQVHHHCL